MKRENREKILDQVTLMCFSRFGYAQLDNETDNAKANYFHFECDRCYKEFYGDYHTNTCRSCEKSYCPKCDKEKFEECCKKRRLEIEDEENNKRLKKASEKSDQFGKYVFSQDDKDQIARRAK